MERGVSFNRKNALDEFDFQKLCCNLNLWLGCVRGAEFIAICDSGVILKYRFAMGILFFFSTVILDVLEKGLTSQRIIWNC